MNASRRCVWVSMLCLLAGACSTYKESGGSGGADFSAEPADRLAQRQDRAEVAIGRFKAADPTLDRFFENAAGYAIFPEVKKGGVGIGAARGEGVVYENGRVVGYATLTQASLGLQLGGQTYSELIFFQAPGDLEEFKEGNTEFSAQVSAVAAAQGAGANADYADGVAIFTTNREGLMFEASVGGQKFTYRPKADRTER